MFGPGTKSTPQTLLSTLLVNSMIRISETQWDLQNITKWFVDTHVFRSGRKMLLPFLLLIYFNAFDMFYFFVIFDFFTHYVFIK